MIFISILFDNKYLPFRTELNGCSGNHKLTFQMKVMHVIHPFNMTDIYSF